MHGSPSSKHVYAVGLAVAGRVHEAVPLLRSAVTARPDRVEFRLNLATAYVRLGEMDLAAGALDAAIDAARAGEIRAAGWDIQQLIDDLRRRRDELFAWISWRTEEYRMLRLRADMLRERLRLGGATTADMVQLARTLLMLRTDADSEETIPEAVTVLEAAYTAEPRNVEVLEQLIYISVASNDRPRRDRLLRELERVDPNTPLLRAFEIDRKNTGGHLAERRESRAAELFELAMAGSAESRAALIELRRLQRGNPDSRECRARLMFAECFVGDRKTALTLAREADADPDLPLEDHCTVAQILWSHDRPRASRHLSAAREMAQDDDDRRFVEMTAGILGERPF
jgi:tetratricopeptide (TPR) repeat protein